MITHRWDTERTERQRGQRDRDLKERSLCHFGTGIGQKPRRLYSIATSRGFLAVFGTDATRLLQLSITGILSCGWLLEAPLAPPRVEWRFFPECSFLMPFPYSPLLLLGSVLFQLVLSMLSRSLALAGVSGRGQC